MANKPVTKIMEDIESGLEEDNSAYKITIEKNGWAMISNCEHCKLCCHSNSPIMMACTPDELSPEIKNPTITMDDGHGFMIWGGEVEPCLHLSSDGCGLDDKRPFLCAAYPFYVKLDEICVNRGCKAVSNYTQDELVEFAKKIAPFFAKKGAAYNFYVNYCTRRDESDCIHTGVSVMDSISGVFKEADKAQKSKIRKTSITESSATNHIDFDKLKEFRRLQG